MQIKYIPLLYTYNTRLHTYKALITFLIENYCWYLVAGVILYWDNPILRINEFLYMYIFSYTIFLAFYELGYIWNDYIAHTREKNGEKRISTKILRSNMGEILVVRIIIVIGGCSFLLHLDKEFFQLFFIIIGMTTCIFIFHNIIRNFYVNSITFFMLRFCKLSIFLGCLYWSSNGKYITIFILYFFIENLSINLDYLTKKYYLQKIHGKKITARDPFPEILFRITFYTLMPIFGIMSYVLTGFAIHILYALTYSVRWIHEIKKISYSKFNR